MTRHPVSFHLGAANHLIIDRGNVFHGFDLLTEHFEFRGVSAAAEHEFDGHDAFGLGPRPS
jgi:hypothetical protein